MREIIEKLYEKEDQLVMEAEKALEEGKAVKGFGKAFLGGAIEGAINGVIGVGLTVIVVGAVSLIANSKKLK